MCAKASRAASPPGCRHGLDESVSAVSRLNDVFAEAGAARAWARGADIFVQKREIITFGRRRLYCQMNLNWINGSEKDLLRVQWSLKEH